MSGRQHWNVWLAAAFVLAGTALCAAGPAQGDASADSVARLEALVQAQQQRIDALEKQVSTATTQDIDQARRDQMRALIKEILSEEEFRETLMPASLQAGYDKGFFIRSSDDKFKLKFNGQFQFRWTHYNTRKNNRYLAPGFNWPGDRDRTGFDIARLRLRFSGHLFDPKLTYLVEFDGSANKGTPYDVTLFYAWANYKFVDAFQVMVGQFRSGGTRADVASTAMMQFPDYPTMNAVFGLGNSTGVRIWGQPFSKRLEYYLDVVNSLGNPSTTTITNDETWLTTGHDNNPAIIFRTVFHALTGGCQTPPDDAINHFAAPCDMEYHTDPALDFGFHYAFNDDLHDGSLRIPFARRSLFRPGGFGLTSSDGLQIHQFGFDSGFKFRGFSLTGEYVLRLLDVRNADHAPFTPLFLLTGEDSTVAQHGGYLQAGYFLPIPGFEKKVEVVARVGGVSALTEEAEGTWDYGAGVNYYIEGHRVKLQMDVTKIQEAPISSGTYSLANVNDDALVWRVQLQVAF